LDDWRGTRRAAGDVDWMRSTVLGAGLVLSAVAFDDTLSRRPEKHKDKDWRRPVVKLGDALPLAAIGLSGVFAFDESRPRLSDTGVAAVEAGAPAFVAAPALKYRARRAPPRSGE